MRYRVSFLFSFFEIVGKYSFSGLVATVVPTVMPERRRVLPTVRSSLRR